MRIYRKDDIDQDFISPTKCVSPNLSISQNMHQMMSIKISEYVSIYFHHLMSYGFGKVDGHMALLC